MACTVVQHDFRNWNQIKRNGKGKNKHILDSYGLKIRGHGQGARRENLESKKKNERKTVCEKESQESNLICFLIAEYNFWKSFPFYPHTRTPFVSWIFTVWHFGLHRLQCIRIRFCIVRHEVSSMHSPTAEHRTNEFVAVAVNLDDLGIGFKSATKPTNQLIDQQNKLFWMLFSEFNEFSHRLLQSTSNNGMCATLSTALTIRSNEQTQSIYCFSFIWTHPILCFSTSVSLFFSLSQ